MSDFCPFCRHQRLGMAQLRPHCQNCQRRMHCEACESLLRSDGSCQHCQPMDHLADGTWLCMHRASGYACRTRSVFEARGVESHDLERCTACGLYYVTFTDDAGTVSEVHPEDRANANPDAARPFTTPPARVIPMGGWEQGLVRLLERGECPWCRGKIRHVRKQKGLTWECGEGCNP